MGTFSMYALQRSEFSAYVLQSSLGAVFLINLYVSKLICHVAQQINLKGVLFYFRIKRWYLSAVNWCALRNYRIYREVSHPAL